MKLNTLITTSALAVVTAFAGAQAQTVPERQSNTVGTQRVLIVVTTAKGGVAGERVPADVIAKELEGAERLSNNFTHNSYHRTNIDPVVFPYYVEDRKGSDLRWPAVAAVDPSYRESDWDRIWFSNKRGGAGLANVGGPLIWTDMTGGATDHELAHTYGVVHPKGVSIPGNLAPYTKIRWNWLEENGPGVTNSFVDMRESGIVRLYDYYHSGDIPDGYRALRISGTNVTAMMEFRKGFAGEQFDGLAIHDGDDKIDTTPGTTARESADWKDGHLAVGRKWTQDPAEFEVVSVGRDGDGPRYADVRVALPDDYYGEIQEELRLAVQPLDLEGVVRAAPGETLDFRIGTNDRETYYFICADYASAGSDAYSQIRCGSAAINAGVVEVSWTVPSTAGAYDLYTRGWFRDDQNMTRQTDRLETGVTVLVGDVEAPAPAPTPVPTPTPTPQPEPDPEPASEPTDTVSDGAPFAQAGVASVASSRRIDTKIQSLGFTPTEPIVVLGPVSSVDADPLTTRVSSRSGMSFGLYLDEYGDQDHVHAEEAVPFLAIEAGDHVLSDGTRLTAGTTSADDEWKTVRFAERFDVTPVVVVQTASSNGRAAVATRLRNVTHDGFEVHVQEEEAKLGSGHSRETVHYVAMEPGTATHDGHRVIAATVNGVNDQMRGYAFRSAYAETPVVLASMQTFNGGDTAAVRAGRTDRYGVELIVEEETSKDAETRHASETVGIITLPVGMLTE